jgi:DNA-binding NarL/FixJ family response regulator
MLHDENETHDLPSLEAAFDKAIDWKPDLLLLGSDVVTDRGVEVIQLIRSRLPGAKVLLVAEDRDDPLVGACQKVGIDGLLVKPLTVEETRRRVDGLLGRKRVPIQIHAL